jgi:exodeoxyribonuclease V alpha subunit
MDDIHVVQGQVEQIVYQAGDSSYAIAQFCVAENQDRIKIVGNFAQLQTGQTLELQGIWKTHPKYGKQFQVTQYQECLPTSSEGLVAYLASGLFEGIGKAIAKRIVEQFGDQTLEILDHAGDRLGEVPGLSPKRIQKIKESWKEQHAARQSLIFLQGHGLTLKESIRVWETFTAQTIDTVRKNPYALTDIERIGFITADRIAGSLGFTAESEFRYQSALFYALEQAMQNEGHCCLPLQKLIEKAAKLLPQPNHRPNLEQLRTLIQQLVQTQQLRRHLGAGPLQGEELIYLPAPWAAETGVAERLKSLRSQRITLDRAKAQKNIDAYCQKHKITLAEEQQAAVHLALASGVAVLVGQPGTGKTFTLQVLVSLWADMGKQVALASPTGRAAQRLSEMTGAEAKTLHRLLEFNPTSLEFERNADTPLKAEVVIVDETSMLDIFLAQALLSAIPPNAQLLLVGDPDQLPSVSAGQVLQDILDSAQIPIARLTEIFRQAQSSAIVTNAHLIHHGQMPILSPFLPAAMATPASNCLWLRAETPTQTVQALAALVTEGLPQLGYSPATVQVLVPMRKGDAGTVKLNRVLQDLLNPASPDKFQMERGEIILRVGDRVIQQLNNYTEDIFNGDIGVITAIDASASKVTVQFPEKSIVYNPQTLNDMTHGFSLTVHKSQGSEYPVVIFVLLTDHYPMLRRNLLYTGLTRARQLAIFVGSERAISTAIRIRDSQRYTQLSHHMAASIAAITSASSST